MHISSKISINVQFRSLVALGLGVSLIFFIALRLWYLQIIHGDEFRIKSENNRIRTVYLPPPRGLLFDRNGAVMVKNRPAFNIELIKEDCPDPKETVGTISSLTKESFDELWGRMQDNRKRRRFEPKLLLKDVSRETVAIIEANRYRLPGVVVTVTPARNYQYGTVGAHVLGYIREITGEQLEKPQFANYRIGDMVGQYGVEKRWEQFLQGKRGIQDVVVDASGTRIGKASYESEVAGHNIFLTIDLQMQLAAEEGLGKSKGAVVAMDANTGEILALVSHPAFDPNRFAGELTADDWKELISGKDKPMNNRALQGAYPPGSVFKIFTSFAGLTEGTITPHSSANCPGFYTFAGRPYRCHKKSGHGHVDLRSAVAMSCDVFFYQLGQRLGINNIAKYMAMLGLGRKTGLDLGDESSGIVPSEEWKRNYFKTTANQKWYPGETLSVAIGQGATTTTPIQIARAITAIANGGKLLKPYIIREIESTDKTTFRDSESFKPEVESTLPTDQKNLQIVRDAMEAVVLDARGTGHNASLQKEFGISVAGKTGTAQVAGLQFHRKGSQLDDHAWFAGYAPAAKPEIVVVGLVENGGHGGAAAAPVVKATMIAYFEKKLPRLDKKPDAAKP